jgi:hypothetical protein
MRVELFVLNCSKELVRQSNPESVFAAIDIVAFVIDSGLVGEVGRAADNKYAGWPSTGDIACVNVYIDGPALAHLARPSVNVVLVALKRDAVDHPSHSSWMGTLSVSRRRSQWKADSKCREGRKRIRETWHRDL